MTNQANKYNAIEYINNSIKKMIFINNIIYIIY